MLILVLIPLWIVVPLWVIFRKTGINPGWSLLVLAGRSGLIEATGR